MRAACDVGRLFAIYRSFAFAVVDAAHVCHAPSATLDERAASKQPTHFASATGKDRRPHAATAKRCRSKPTAWTGQDDQRSDRFVKWRQILAKGALATGAARKKAIVAVARQLAVDLWRIKTGRLRAQELGLIN